MLGGLRGLAGRLRGGGARRGTAASRKRLKRMQKRRMRKAFTGFLMDSYGLGDYGEARAEEGQKQFRRDRVKPGLAKLRAAKIVDLPSMNQPERVQRSNAPDIASINDQFKALIKAAEKIGAVTLEQQKALVGQIRSANMAAKENQLEGGERVSGAPQNDGGEITPPLDPMVEKLSEAINELYETIKDKIKEQAEEDGKDYSATTFRRMFMDNMGLGDYDRARTKEKRIYRGFTSGKNLKNLSAAEVQVLEKQGFKRAANGAMQAPGGRFASKAQLESALRSSHAAATNKPSAIGSRTDKIAKTFKGLFKGSARVAAVGADAGKAAEKIARPMAVKAFGKGVLKSIPILGAAAGVGFAAKRLLEGDVVGAGLEAASGLGGPLTAIPAIAATMVRDVYREIFGVQPEEDPMVGDRVSLVTEGVNTAIKSVLADSIEPVKPKNKPTSQPAAKTSSQSSPQAAKQAGSSPTNQDMSPVASGGGSGTPTSGGAPGGSVTSGTSTAAGAGAAVSSAGGWDVASGGDTGGAAVASPTAAPPPEEPSTPYPAAEQIMEKVEPTVGAAIMESSALNQSLMETPSISTAPGSAPAMPAHTPTTRPGAMGVGNVPTPTYSPPDSVAFDKIYFTIAA